MTMSEQDEDTAQTLGEGSEIGSDLAALCLRFVLGLIVLGHGLQKAGWFKAPGWPASISEQADFVFLLGYNEPRWTAWLITITEVVSGALLLLGLLTPFAAAAVIGIGFQLAAGPQSSGGLFSSNSNVGLDQSLILMSAAAALGFIGAGRYSFDSQMPSWVRGWRGGTIAIAIGIIVGAIVLFGVGVGLGNPPVVEY